MSVLEFIASGIASLAWPATVLTIVFLLREQIGQVLARLTKLRYKELDLDFGREVRELEARAREAHIEPVKQALPEPVRSATTPGDEFAEAERLVSDFPAPAVAVAWGAVEQQLTKALNRVGYVPTDLALHSPLQVAKYLEGHNHLDHPTVDIIGRMRNLRNKAVHGGLGPEGVSSDEAVEFIALARGVAAKLSSISGQ